MDLTYSIEEITLTYMTALVSRIESADGSSIKEVEILDHNGLTAYVPADCALDDAAPLKGYDEELEGLAAIMTKEARGIRQIFETGHTRMVVPLELQDALTSDSVDSITIMDGEDIIITIKSRDWIL